MGYGYSIEENPYWGYEHVDRAVFPAEREGVSGDVPPLSTQHLRGVVRRLYAGTQVIYGLLNGQVDDEAAALESLDALLVGAGRDIESVVNEYLGIGDPDEHLAEPAAGPRSEAEPAGLRLTGTEPAAVNPDEKAPSAVESAAARGQRVRQKGSSPAGKTQAGRKPKKG